VVKRAISGLILAGGQGRRVNEADKGLLPWRGQPLVAHVTQRLAPQVGALYISANRHLETYAQYGKVLPDDAALGPWQGPLAGLAAGLAACRDDWLVCVPCDTPLIPRDLVLRLTQAAEHAGASMAVVSSQGRRHAVCMAARAALAQDLRAYLAAGDRKVALWQDRVGAIEVAFDDEPQAFINLNTAEDFAFAQG
ncbi:molybdopterin-guanine dinucleotide biosynthesis protein A, partial [Bordetella avium 197N]